jgi:hypothetical protein
MMEDSAGRRGILPAREAEDSTVAASVVLVAMAALLVMAHEIAASAQVAVWWKRKRPHDPA